MTKQRFAMTKVEARFMQSAGTETCRPDSRKDNSESNASERTKTARIIHTDQAPRAADEAAFAQMA